jgi:hypothetical protein
LPIKYHGLYDRKWWFSYTNKPWTFCLQKTLIVCGSFLSLQNWLKLNKCLNILPYAHSMLNKWTSWSGSITSLPISTVRNIVLFRFYGNWKFSVLFYKAYFLILKNERKPTQNWSLYLHQINNELTNSNASLSYLHGRYHETYYICMTLSKNSTFVLLR